MAEQEYKSLMDYNSDYTPEQKDAIEALRASYKLAEQAVMRFCPHSRRRSAALTETEKGLMLAIKSIANGE